MKFASGVKFVTAAIAAACLLASCGATRFVYDHADWYLERRASSYLDVHGAETRALDRAVVAFLQWHRARALPQYARLCSEAAAKLAAGLSRRDLLWGYDSSIAQAKESLRAAAGEIAPLLDRLTAEQVEHLARRLAEDDKKYAREHLAGSPESSRARRVQRNVEGLEEWVGALTERQIDRVHRYVESTPLEDELRAGERGRRERELLEIVRARQAGARLAQWAGSWDSRPDAWLDMLFDIERSLTPAQRARAVARLRGFADDFGRLAARDRSS